MPIEFFRETCTVYGHYTVCDSVKLDIVYDGSGRRISKTSLRKNVNSDDWTLEQITHYTGIGSEIRKEYHNGELQSTKVVVNMPQGLGRYGIENADGMAKGDEFYLKNHLGSTMMVAQVSSTNASEPAKVAAAYDYRAFGEQVTLKKSADKVTENFTGKELDDETELDYFGARYLDPMLGMWTSVDPARQFASPYLYAGNGMNPVNGVDDDGKDFDPNEGGDYVQEKIKFGVSKTNDARIIRAMRDPTRLFRFFDNTESETKIEPSDTPDPKYKKTYNVFIHNLDAGKNEYFSDIITILIGHELDHPYTWPNGNHNFLEPVQTPEEYYKAIEKMSKEKSPDQIYLNDYNSAKEMGIYDKK